MRIQRLGLSSQNQPGTVVRKQKSDWTSKPLIMNNTLLQRYIYQIAAKYHEVSIGHDFLFFRANLSLFPLAPVPWAQKRNLHLKRANHLWTGTIVVSLTSEVAWHPWMNGYLAVAGFKRPITTQASSSASDEPNHHLFVLKSHRLCHHLFIPEFKIVQLGFLSKWLRIQMSWVHFCFSPETFCANWGNGSLAAG